MMSMDQETPQPAQKRRYRHRLPATPSWLTVFQSSVSSQEPAFGNPAIRCCFHRSDPSAANHEARQLKAVHQIAHALCVGLDPYIVNNLMLRLVFRNYTFHFSFPWAGTQTWRSELGVQVHVLDASTVIPASHVLGLRHVV